MSQGFELPQLSGPQVRPVAEDIAAHFAALVDAQPTVGQQQANTRSFEEQKAAARQSFIEFVTTTAQVVANELDQYQVADYFTTLGNSRGIGATRGYMLREHYRYGARRAGLPREDFGLLGESDFDRDQVTFNRALVVVAGTGELAVTKWNCSAYHMVEHKSLVTPGEWLMEGAIQTPEDAMRLQAEATADFEAAAKKYASQRRS